MLLKTAAYSDPKDMPVELFKAYRREVCAQITAYADTKTAKVLTDCAEPDRVRLEACQGLPQCAQATNELCRIDKRLWPNRLANGLIFSYISSSKATYENY